MPPKDRSHELSASRLHALVEAGVALSGTLDIDKLLKQLVRIACRVVGARFGALGVIDESGTSLERFIFHGITAKAAQEIGSPPKGLGLLGALIADPRPVRLEDISTDGRSVGFPANHPPMRTFLGVPVVARGRVFGNLYLTEKRRGATFTQGDQDIAIALAAQAGVAIENARLFAEEGERVRAEAELALKADLLRQVLRAQEDERARVSRDLHDSAGQALASILLGLKVAERATTQDDMRARIADLRDLTSDAVAQIRRLALELRPPVLGDLGVEAALDRYVSDFRSRSALKVSLRTRGAGRLDPDVETVLYRVVQEALNNVAKHSGAAMVSVRLDTTGHQVRLSVRDDGCGFVPEERSEGIGLRGMYERVGLVGGTLSIRSAPGAGTAISVTVPRG